MAIQIEDCGLKDYSRILEMQRVLHRKRIDGQVSDTILLVEHFPVITLGARKKDNKLLCDADQLQKKGISVIEVERGGAATAHNPGQIVFYPIVNLKQLNLEVSAYVRKLEQIGIELLSKLGVNCDRRKGFPGLWVGQKKIASLGVKVSKWVTFHGMAINICNDLSIFDNFVPCGLEGVEMTSVLNETGQKIETNDVKNKLTIILEQHFGEVKN